MITFWTAVASAFIGGIFSMVVALLGIKSTRDKMLQSFDKSVAVMQEQLKELTRQVEKHNHVVERMGKAEQDIAVLKSKAKVE